MLCSVSSDGWGSGLLLAEGAAMQHACELPPTQLANSFSLTIKDLLLSGTPEPVSPHSVKLHEAPENI